MAGFAGPSGRPCGDAEPALQQANLFPKLFVFGRQRLLARREVMIVFPPIEANLLCLVDRTNQQPNANRQQLDFRERNLNVPRDDESLIELAGAR